jgi:hypothetical protein
MPVATLDTVRSLLIAAAVGLIVGLLSHAVGVVVILLGITFVAAGIVLTLTVIGAVIGIPLGLLGALAIALGAFGASSTTSGIVLGILAGLLTYTRLERRHTQPVH